MDYYNFLKPTKLFKEYLILDMIEKDSNITQRVIASAIDSSVSIVNDYLFCYEEEDLIIKTKYSNKNVEYFLTKKGLQRRKVLNVSYLNASQKLYNLAKENIENFLLLIESKGYKNILLYGAGEVCEILLNTINSSKNINIKALAVIDDDRDKIGKQIAHTNIIARAKINDIDHDGILISSYTNNEEIYKKLVSDNYNKDNIIQFFNV